MAYSNIDIQKLLTDNASIQTVAEKCPDALYLNILAEGLYADITFEAKGGIVKAHRSVLAMASVVFRKMFQQQTKALELPSIVSLPQLPDIAIESLQLFLVLLYITNEKTKAMPEFNDAVDKHFTTLFDAAHKFQVDVRLNVVLEAGLLRHLTPANCWDFYHKCQDLAKVSEHNFSQVCLSYVVKNGEKVMKSVTTTVMEMQRDPKVVQHCMAEAMSNSSRRESSRQKTTPKRYKRNVQPHHYPI